MDGRLSAKQAVVAEDRGAGMDRLSELYRQLRAHGASWHLESLHWDDTSCTVTGRLLCPTAGVETRVTASVRAEDVPEERRPRHLAWLLEEGHVAWRQAMLQRLQEASPKGEEASNASRYS